MDTGGEHTGQDREVMSVLAALAPLTGPTAGERDRIRERVLAGLTDTAEPGTTHQVAVAEDTEPAASAAGTTVVADDVTTSTDRVRPRRHRAVAGRVARARRGPRGRRDATRGGGRDDRPARPVSGARARFAIAAVAVLALVGSLTGMSLLLARDALPGDALYGFKRTAEAASLGLTFGDESKALKHLDFASARVSEIETLAHRYPEPATAPTGSYLTALTDFDTDAAAGSRQLIALATRADGSQLELLGAWARQHRDRLNGIELPASVRASEAASVALLGTIAGRADALLARMDCYQITSGSFDEVGALPASGRCEKVAAGGPPRDVPASSNEQEGGPRHDDQPAPPAARSTTPTTPPATDLPEDEDPPLLPLPGVGSVLPGTGRSEQPPADGGGSPDIELPLPLPGIELPPLLPGLPGIVIGR
ncbi:hypothetical protein BLA60_28125 [Actinophytocola xinjiangensis]|uniref:DUF5667 domain-containing protein n=1 Tax=Actinophytocola xinjiangensis TaxID=485602 RepID=A0A7Z0WI98_9PSEU|nr:DUF5667 domain-containing protein [Actinophytocola xinjiangensis]OLF07091.1 hypothetical protein BLA60_28125 [Actinophytocola xinjiangensis]